MFRIAVIQTVGSGGLRSKNHTPKVAVLFSVPPLPSLPLSPPGCKVQEVAEQCTKATGSPPL